MNFELEFFFYMACEPVSAEGPRGPAYGCNVVVLFALLLVV